MPTQRLNAMKESGTLDHVVDTQLKQEKKHNEKNVFSYVILVRKGRVSHLTIHSKRKAVEQAFDALEAGLSPDPLSYDDEPSEIEGWVEYTE